MSNLSRLLGGLALFLPVLGHAQTADVAPTILAQVPPSLQQTMPAPGAADGSIQGGAGGMSPAAAGRAGTANAPGGGYQGGANQAGVPQTGMGQSGASPGGINQGMTNQAGMTQGGVNQGRVAPGGMNQSSGSQSGGSQASGAPRPAPSPADAAPLSAMPPAAPGGAAQSAANPPATPPATAPVPPPAPPQPVSQPGASGGSAVVMVPEGAKKITPQVTLRGIHPSRDKPRAGKARHADKEKSRAARSHGGESSGAGQ